MKHTESGSRGDMQKDERENESKTVNRSTEGGKIRKERGRSEMESCGVSDQ